MREFTTPSFPVYMYDGEGNYTVKTMGEVTSLSSKAPRLLR
jgi:cytidine deaminase